MRLVVFLAAAAALAIACGEKDGAATDAGPDSSTACPWDQDDDPTAASALVTGTAAEGYICPKGDQDWYSLSVSPPSNLLRIDLAVDAPVSPLNLTYGVWNGAADEVLLSPESSESASAGEPLGIVHSLGAGEYKLVVRNRTDDADDVWHPYSLTATTLADPDANEPNNAVENATVYGSASAQGYIAFRGDQDWFRIEAAAHDLLTLRLTMPAGGIEPAFTVLDAVNVALSTGVNEGGKIEPTDLSIVQALDTAGTYYVVIHDDGDLDFDLENPYELELEVAPDPDINEANDHPDEATALGSLQCDLYPSAWSEWIENTGYIASSGDVDWYGLELLSCGASVIEIEVAFDSPGSLPDNLEAAVRLVHQVESFPCAVDSECVEVPLACDCDLDCSRYGNTCLTSGLCAGAGVCLGGATCGVDYMTAAAEEGSPGAALLSAPLFWIGGSYYVAVADYQGDGYSADHAYTVRARVRKDPDLFEPSEAMTAGPAGSDDPAINHIAYAHEIPVHDCTAADCCNSSTWVEAYLAYAYDQDWYAYPHPCPGEDCMVRVNYELDEGPVDFYMQVYEGEEFWFDNLSDATDPGDQPAQSGHFGGLSSDDYCFYAYQGHVGDPFYYYLPVRDTVYVAEGYEDDGNWDWSTEQAYRLCVEKIADGCVDPCFLYDDGCGAP